METPSQSAPTPPAEPVAQLAAEHLRAHFPDLTAQATPDELAQAAQAGLQAARGHGFNRRPQMYFMVHLASALGSQFDTDPQYGWLRPLLDNQPGLPAHQRSRVMGWHLDVFRARAYGADLAMCRSVLSRLVALDRQTLSRVGDGLATEGPLLLATLFPGRLGFMDREAMFNLLHAAQRGAAMHHGTGNSGTALLLLLMFLFGHQVMHDPLRRWLRHLVLPTMAGNAPLSMEALMRTVADHAAASLDALWKIKP